MDNEGPADPAMDDIARIVERHRGKHWCTASSQAEDGGLFEDFFPDKIGRCDAETALRALAKAILAEDAERALADRLAEALQLIQEYIGDVPDWSWFDALAAYREARQQVTSK